MQKRLVARLGVAFILAGAMWLAYSQGPPQPAKLDLVKIKDDLYRIHEMIVATKSRDKIAQMLRKEYHWEQLHMDRGLDGALAELR